MTGFKVEWHSLSVKQQRFILNEFDRWKKNMGLNSSWKDLSANDQQSLLKMFEAREIEWKATRRAALERSGLPKSYWNDSKLIGPPVLVEKINDINSYLDTGDGIFICGVSGTGKTALASKIIHRAIEFNHSPYFYQAWKLQEYYENKAEYDGEKTLLKHLMTVSLLVIDGVGQETASYNKSIIPELIISRVEDCKATVVTSCKKKAELPDNYLRAKNWFDKFLMVALRG